MSFDGAHVREWRSEVRWNVGHAERLLWALVALSLVGDLATTFAGLHVGLTESNPIARGAIDGYGVAGMVGLKVGAIAVALVGRSLLPDEYGPIVPAGLAVPWLGAVAVNLYVISLVV